VQRDNDAAISIYERWIKRGREVSLSQAMVYRLLARYRQNPSPSELLPKRRGQQTGAHRLSPEVEAVIQRLVHGYYLKSQRPRIIDLYIDLPSVALTASVSTDKGKNSTNERTKILLIKE
jgi:hypothetical protein